MKKIFLLSAAVGMAGVVGGAYAEASGCADMYDIRTEQRRVVSKVPGSDYQIHSYTEKEMQIEMRSGERLILPATKGKMQATSTPQNLYKVDVIFEEGSSDCGPVYRCVTGQYLFTADPFELNLVSFSFPLVEDTLSVYPGNQQWLAWRVLPPWSDLKVEGESGMGMPKQCVYGNW